MYQPATDAYIALGRFPGYVAANEPRDQDVHRKYHDQSRGTPTDTIGDAGKIVIELVGKGGIDILKQQRYEADNAHKKCRCNQ